MKILLIMPNFFDYPRVIKQGLENMGHEVDFFDDRPSTSGIIKAIIRLNRNLINHYIERYFDNIMNYAKTKQYDVVFLISGQSLSFSREMLERLKNQQKKAKFVLYQWDSVQNFQYIEKMQDLFDEKYSFDRIDVQNNAELKFLPLFYSDQYKIMGSRLSTIEKDFSYDFCFVGTAHPKKYEFIKVISEQFSKVFTNQFIYLYLPSRLVFLYRKLCNMEMRKAKYSEFHFKPIAGEQFEKIYMDSMCVLDSPQGGQDGLTIRIIEALGAKKKVITTNKDIVNYDFYCPENFYVYDGNIDLNNVFFSSEYKEIDIEIYNKYSLNTWLNEIIGY